MQHSIRAHGRLCSGSAMIVARLSPTVRAALWRLERRQPEPSRETGLTIDRLVAEGWGERTGRRAVKLTEAGRQFIRDNFDNPEAPALRT